MIFATFKRIFHILQSSLKSAYKINLALRVLEKYDYGSEFKDEVLQYIPEIKVSFHEIHRS